MMLLMSPGLHRSPTLRAGVSSSFSLLCPECQVQARDPIHIQGMDESPFYTQGTCSERVSDVSKDTELANARTKIEARSVGLCPG